MRILQVISGMGVNGAVLQCMALSRALVSRGHQVILACRPGSWTSSQPETKGLRLVCSELRRWPHTDFRRMTSLLRRQQIDVVHTHQSRAHVFGIFLRYWTKTPCVATAHARHVQPHWCLNDYVLANSEATYDFHRRWNLVPDRRMRVVHYLLDLQRFAEPLPDQRDALRSTWGVSGDDLLAGIIGDVIPRKGHIYAVRAWAAVRRTLPNAWLAIIGNETDQAYSRLLRSEAERLGVADRIVWAGYRTDVPVVMQAMDVCVSAAVEEALGLTIPEAMAASRAVVATNVGGVPENVRSMETGMLVPPADPAALSEALIRVLADGPWRIQCGRRGRELVWQKYDPQRQLCIVEEIYGQLANHAA